MPNVCMIAARLSWGGPASAASFEHCSRPDAKVARAAILGAANLAMRAAADTAEHGHWFGHFTSRNGEQVRAGA